MMALPAVPPLKDTDQTHPSHGPIAAACTGLIDIQKSPLLLCLSISPSHHHPPCSRSIFPSLFRVALQIKALLKDESRGPLQTKKERELDPASNGGE